MILPYGMSAAMLRLNGLAYSRADHFLHDAFEVVVTGLSVCQQGR